MVKTYTRVVLNLALLSAVYGFLLPWMISASDNFLIVAGVFLGVFIVPVAVYSANKQFVITLMEKFK